MATTKRKQAIGFRDSGIGTMQRIVTIEAMDQQPINDLGQKLDRYAGAIKSALQEPVARRLGGVREIKRQQELDEILEELQLMVKKSPETAYRYADKIAAMKLKAELDGHLKTHSEEKHLHLHSDVIGMSEDQLRRELLMMGSNSASGTPQGETEAS